MASLAGSSVLVTGADGFIGSHLVEALVDLKCKVTALSYYNSFNTWGWLDFLEDKYKEKIEVITGDIRDASQMDAITEGREYVFHLAALIGVPFSYRSPRLYVDTNVHGTLNLLESAKRHRIKKFIHTSTSEVYGSAQTVPISEEHPLIGQSPYAATKIAADQLAVSYHRSFELPVTVLRPFNTYGPRQSARAVIPTIISQVVAGRTVKLGALHPRRDLTYVGDTVDGFICAAESEQAIGQQINLGTGFDVSVGEIVEAIGEIMNEKIEVVTDPQRLRPKLSEVERLVANNKKAETVLGWVPKYQGLEGLRKGLVQTIEWYKSIESRIPYKTQIYNV